MLRGPVFTPSPTSNERISTRSMRRRVDMYLGESNLKRPKLSAHSLRSTAATLLMESGATLLEMQMFLGHKSPETTIRYIGRLDKLADQAATKIPLKVK